MFWKQKMHKLKKDLSDFDKEEVVIGSVLGQYISKTIGLVFFNISFSICSF